MRFLDKKIFFSTSSASYSGVDHLDNDKSRLKMELAMLKKKGVSSSSIWSPDPSRACGRCRSELGRIMNRGAYCKSCRVKVCKNCREYGVKGTDWICNVCHKNLEIKVASGEWVNEYLNKIPPKKKHSKLLLPGSSILEGATKKKNIRRSWTISNPSGTLGPQLPVRRINSGDPELKSYAKVDASIIHDDLHPKGSSHIHPPPVFMSVPQAPIPSRGKLRAPIRSQSMSQADSDRFFASGRPRYAGAPYRRPSQSYEESSSENEEPWPHSTRVVNNKSAAASHKKNNLYATANSNTSSLDRRKQRRSAPRPTPSHSLPRPPKRVPENSTHRREPTPDYDELYSEATKGSGRMKSDSGVDESTSSSIINPHNSSSSRGYHYRNSEGRRHSLTEKKQQRFHFDEEEGKSSRIEEDITLSDLESTRVDDYGSLGGDPEDEYAPSHLHSSKKPHQSNEFKLVFISSSGDSSKESEVQPETRKSRKSGPERGKKSRSVVDSLLSDSERIPLSSPSTVRTSQATKDPGSPSPESPGRIPKVHHIPILLNEDHDHQDAEVQSILRDSRYFSTVREKEFLRVALLADVSALVPASSPNRSLSESDLSEVQDLLLGSSSRRTSPSHDEYVLPWKREQAGRVKQGEAGTGGPPLPPKKSSRRPEANNTTNRVHIEEEEEETFVDTESNSLRLPSKKKLLLSRSVSNVSRDLGRSRPPVRRSKSYKGSKTVTNIRFDESETGSHTLPKKKHGEEDQQKEEDVIITRQGANFVRIQIGPKGPVEERKISLEELEVDEEDPSKEELVVVRPSSNSNKQRRRGSLIKTSDTEGDFLDKDHHHPKQINHSDLLHQRLEEKRRENQLSALLSNDRESLKSDVDSLSTTSASYIVPHSDEELEGDRKSLLLSSSTTNSNNNTNSSPRQLEAEEIQEEEEEMNNLKRPGRTSSSSKDDTCAPAHYSSSTSILNNSSVSNSECTRNDSSFGASRVSDLIARFENSNSNNNSNNNSSVAVTTTSSSEKSAKNAPGLASQKNFDCSFEEEEEEEELPLGAEASSVSQVGPPESEDMAAAPSVRRNSGGAYTSYVFISSNEGGGEGSVASGVTVHGVNLQDGRSSNISIVSTESSSDGSHTTMDSSESNYDSPQELPSKSNSANSVGPNSELLPSQERSRGGEPAPEDMDSFDPNVQDEGLANYFTNSLEASSTPSRRRMRPSVIRSSGRRLEDTDDNHHEESEHEEEDAFLSEASHEEDNRVSSPSSSYHDEDEREEHELYSDDYDVEYEDPEDFMDYPMCQPVYDDSDLSDSELLSSGDEDFGGEREEELRGYNRAIDFTLHTIIEESCEESDSSSTCHLPPRMSDPSELEKYFYYGVGGGQDLQSCESSFSEEEEVHYQPKESATATAPSSSTSSAESESGPLSHSAGTRLLEDGSGPVRKHKSRDSGFVGSCDDLLRNESSHPQHLNTDSAPSLPSDDGTEGSLKYSSPRLNRLSEIHEVPRKEEEDIHRQPEAWESEEVLDKQMKTFIRSLLHPQGEDNFSRLLMSLPGILDASTLREILQRLVLISEESDLGDEEEYVLSIALSQVASSDLRLPESSLRQLAARLLALMKEDRRRAPSWTSSPLENNLPKLTLLPTEAKIRHTASNSLPRLGTSSIQKSSSNSVSPSSSSYSAPGPARSARYRPPGAKPLPPRKISPSIITSSSSSSVGRKFSSETGGILGRFLDDASNDLSSKSGTPSPVIAREMRESSVCSRSSLDTNDEGDGNNSRDERFPSPFTKHGSLSNLGVRSESMASVYSQGEGRYGTVVVRGDVEFGMLHRNGALEVAVKQCRDLAAVDIKRNRSDPYVKVYLLPDKSKSGKRKTKVKKHTLNPVFDEVLKYQIPLTEVEKRTMWLTVWHSDMFGRNDFLGEVMLPLSSVDLGDTQPRWHSLQDRTEPLSSEEPSNPGTNTSSSSNNSNNINYRGELIVALKFVAASENKAKGGKAKAAKGSLQILIKEGKNLISPKSQSGGSSSNIDPFCKCYLLPGKGYKKKTSVCRRTNKPKWEQTITWDTVTLSELSDRSLELTVWDHDRLGQNEMIGGLRFNNGSGKHQHRFVNWMDASGKEVTLWQQMLERPNFWVEGSVHLRPVDKMMSSPNGINGNSSNA